MLFHQFTAIDEVTCFRDSRTYDHNNTTTAMQFLEEARKHFPFAIQKIQRDNDSSFGPQFTWHLSDQSFSHRYIPLDGLSSTARWGEATKPTLKNSVEESRFTIKAIGPENSRAGKLNTMSEGLILGLKEELHRASS